MKHQQSIIYVNFSPYDNAGHILDYLTSSFDWVIHFSYDHLRLQNGRKTNILTVYHKKKVVERKQLIPLRTPEFLRFPSLPGVALLILFQTWWHTWHVKRKLGIIDYYLTVNAYTAWIGNILRQLELVDKTVFWVWDYYPPGFPDWRIRFLRWVYWKFDKPNIMAADVLAFISDKLIKLRHDFQSLPIDKPFSIIPIGTDPSPTVPRRKTVIIGFLGMLKESQGLDFLFDALPKIYQQLPKIKIEIIGSGPQEEHFKRRARKWKQVVTFLGYIEKNNEVDTIIRRWSVGLATYVPLPSNESYWTDPSKIKAYLSLGVPVITTSVPYFANEIKRYQAGEVVMYGKTEELISTLQTIMKRRRWYAYNALKLAERYDYRLLYPHFFSAPRPHRLK